VRVLLQGEVDVLRVVVDDEGAGVPPDLHERIFEPFVRGPVVTGRRAGYGLGLALARAAAAAHGGTLSVGDAPGRGARFELTLPRGNQSRSAASSDMRGKITPSGESTAANRRVV
jgi:signal transduction histidine kinase